MKFLIAMLLTLAMAPAFAKRVNDQAGNINTLILAKADGIEKPHTNEGNGSAGVNVDEIWEAVRNTTYIVEGQGNREVFVFFDPFCPHCHIVWQKTRSYISNTKIYWIPLGILRPESLPVAAGLLRGGTVADLTALMGSYRFSPVQADARIRKQLDNNLAVLNKVSTQFPTIFYGSGDKRRVFIGAPDESKLKQIFGQD